MRIEDEGPDLIHPSVIGKGIAMVSVMGMLLLGAGGLLAGIVDGNNGVDPLGAKGAVTGAELHATYTRVVEMNPPTIIDEGGTPIGDSVFDWNCGGDSNACNDPCEAAGPPSIAPKPASLVSAQCQISIHSRSYATWACVCNWEANARPTWSQIGTPCIMCGEGGFGR